MRTLVLALAVGACAGAPMEAPMNDLAGTTWVADNAVTGGRTPTIVFERDRAAGDAPCNQWFATYQRDGESLTFGPIGMTRRGCDQPTMNAERDFASAIEHTSALRFEAGALVLADASGGELARFRRSN